ncbi:MAG: glycerophosphodiester phosphodiesterase [Terriglobales bacterium]
MAGPPLLIGHRGARAIKSVAENTLPSFELALQHGCDGFEFDVQRTGDGRALICHDPKIGRLAVRKVTSNQLPQCPLLEDVLRQCAHRAFLDIELKVRELETNVLAALREWPPHRGYVVSSFLPQVIMELKVRSGAVPVGIICDSRAELGRWRSLPVEYVIVEHRLISRRLMDEVHSAGRRIFAWTVNQPESMMRLAEWDVDGIISDDVELLVRTVRGKDPNS